MEAPWLERLRNGAVQTRRRPPLGLGGGRRPPRDARSTGRVRRSTVCKSRPSLPITPRGTGASTHGPAELGRGQRVRTDRRRAFDFRWMLHTLDEQGRDDFDSLALHAVSSLGLLTVRSGFTLYALRSRAVRSRRGARDSEAG